MGEGLRKLPHPQLWFLVGHRGSRGREVFVTLPTKAATQKKPRARWEQAAEAPKNKAQGKPFLSQAPAAAEGLAWGL